VRRGDDHAQDLQERPFRCPLVPLFPILGILSCMLLMPASVGELAAPGVWLAIGLVTISPTAAGTA
jgi:hypothetical protein